MFFDELRPPSDSTLAEPAPAVARSVGRHRKPIDLARVRDLAGLGLPIEMIAHRLGVSERTLYNRFVSDPAVKQAHDEGVAEATELLTRKLRDMAVRDNNVAAIIFWLKTKGKFTAPKAPAEIAVTVAPAAHPLAGDTDVVDGTYIEEMARRQRELLDLYPPQISN